MHMLVNDEVSTACLISDHFFPPLALPRAFEIFPFIGARYNTRLANSVKRSNHVIAPTLHPCPLRGLTEEMKLDYIPSNKRESPYETDFGPFTCRKFDFWRPFKISSAGQDSPANYLFRHQRQHAEPLGWQRR